MGVDIDNTDNPIEAGLGFAVAWDKPGGFIGRDALLEAREQGTPRHRVVSLIVDDPAADLFGNEPVLADGEWVSYVRAAAYGYTVGGPVGLAQVACDDGVTGQWLKEGDFRVRTPGRGDRCPAADRAAATTRSGCASWTAAGRAAVSDEPGTDRAGPGQHRRTGADLHARAHLHAHRRRAAELPAGVGERGGPRSPTR